MLSDSASKALTETGESAFLIVGRASHPDDPSRWVIHLLPLDMKTASEASEVALGVRKAGKRLSPPPPPPEAVTLTTGGKAGTIETPVQTPRN